MPIEALKAQDHKNKELYLKNKALKPEINNTLKGVLLNNYIRPEQDENYISFDNIKDSLLINNSDSYYSVKQDMKPKDESESSFDVKKALKPLIIGTSVVIAGMLAVSSVLKHASTAVTKAPSFEQLPDLAVNMNIREEPQFALYRAIRDPNSRNILGALGVFAMSGITIAFKNFVEGTKEIWLKKQSADIEKTLQRNLIAVETNAFSGKLKVINQMLDKNVKYFDGIINKTKSAVKKSDIFAPFVTFKGKEEETQETGNKKKPFNIDKNWKYIAITLGVLAGAVIAGKLTINNLRKTAKITNDFANNFAEKTIDSINNMSKNADKNDLPKITELLKAICAKPEYVREIGSKYNLNETEIQNIINSVEQSKKMIFADAPMALGGIPKKIQYYCYIDEDKGHLYNWILNPKNKVTKYIFLSFASTSVGGYLFKEVMDAAKNATVLRENAKTDLDLKKQLVDVEVANFKSKKESAIQPLIDNFTKQANDGKKSKEELKELADNILTEIKTGPPYVYA